MSISLNANFELLSAGLYLDARQQFNTLIEMKDFAETSIPDGFITYNKETQKHYVFSSSNTVDATLGKWREYSGEGSVELTQAEYDALSEEEKMNGTTYFITDGDSSGDGDTGEDIQFEYYTDEEIDEMFNFSQSVVVEAQDATNISKIMKAMSPSTLKIATWNIGHFAYGQDKIPSETYLSRLGEYKTLINSMNLDIIGINEYNDYLNNHGATRDVLFKDFSVDYESAFRGYVCNALFGNTYIENTHLVEYECNKVENSGVSSSENYYYLESDLYMNGKQVKFIVTHLAFGSSDDVLVTAQINELINKYSSCDRVVMMGDWNVKQFSVFNLFIDNGYTMANNNETLSGRLIIDNILAKGLTISNSEVITTNLSDHYPVRCTISL